MKKTNYLKQHYFLVITILLIPLLSFGQTPHELVKEIKGLMIENYISLDQAKAVNVRLDDWLKETDMDALKEPSDLASALTMEMRKITNDKHLRVSPPRVSAPQTEKRPFTAGLNRYYRPVLRGFEYYENNVAYINIGYFGGNADFFSKIDGIMNQAGLADALIIDMRQSHGGSPRGVQYFCSYFFDKDMLLSSIYNRYNDHTEEFQVLDVNGIKRPDVPIYILTSSRTFSAAEDFPYTLQNHGRAKVIGEVTRGGAHPTRGFSLPEGFRIGIPIAMSIHPVSKTNWEGVGITPDVEISADAALNKAKELASEAAITYKNSMFNPLISVLKELEGKQIQVSDFGIVHAQLNEMIKRNIVTQGDINRLGYSYLRDKKSGIASIIFKSNMELFPSAPNTHDSYAEALLALGKKDEAIEQYKLAVRLADEQNDGALSNYQENLESLLKTK